MNLHDNFQINLIKFHNHHLLGRVPCFIDFDVEAFLKQTPEGKKLLERLKLQVVIAFDIDDTRRS